MLVDVLEEVVEELLEVLHGRLAHEVLDVVQEGRDQLGDREKVDPGVQQLLELPPDAHEVLQADAAELVLPRLDVVLFQDLQRLLYHQPR